MNYSYSPSVGEIIVGRNGVESPIVWWVDSSEDKLIDTELVGFEADSGDTAIDFGISC